jgi:hypothetical protein
LPGDKKLRASTWKMVHKHKKKKKRWHKLVKGNLLCQMVLVGVPEMLGDATFIHLKVAIQLAFSAEEDNKTMTNNVSHCHSIFSLKTSGMSSI